MSKIEVDRDLRAAQVAPPARRYRVEDCEACTGAAATGEGGPPHDASSKCESGRHPHCSCDTCF